MLIPASLVLLLSVLIAPFTSAKLVGEEIRACELSNHSGLMKRSCLTFFKKTLNKLKFLRDVKNVHSHAKEIDKLLVRMGERGSRSVLGFLYQRERAAEVTEQAWHAHQHLLNVFDQVSTDSELLISKDERWTEYRRIMNELMPTLEKTAFRASQIQVDLVGNSDLVMLYHSVSELERSVSHLQDFANVIKAENKIVL